MKWVMRVIQALLALSFIESGVVKLMGSAKQIQQFQGFGFSMGFMYFIGVCELLGGLGLIAGYWKKILGTLASIGLVIVMAGASFSHIHAGEKIRTATTPIILLLLCLVLIIWNIKTARK